MTNFFMAMLAATKIGERCSHRDVDPEYGTKHLRPACNQTERKSKEARPITHKGRLSRVYYMLPFSA